jgi:hypothetical protein
MLATLSCLLATHSAVPQDAALRKQRLVLYSSNDPKKKANAALLMALYMVSLALITSHILY